jgi:glycerol-3-phosphate dehydrogenase
VAERVVELVFKKLGKKPPKSRTDATPVYGGEIENFDRFQRHSMAQQSLGLSPEVMNALLHNHGSRYGDVLKYAFENPSAAQTMGSSNVIKAEVIHAAREEMAQKLTDVTFRRTNLGTGEYPGDLVLQTCAGVMAAELGWDKHRVRREIAEAKAAFPPIAYVPAQFQSDDRIAK